MLRLFLGDDGQLIYFSLLQKIISFFFKLSVIYLIGRIIE